MILVPLAMALQGVSYAPMQVALQGFAVTTPPAPVVSTPRPPGFIVSMGRMMGR